MTNRIRRVRLPSIVIACFDGVRLREAIEEMGHNYLEVMRFLNNSARGSVELRGPMLEVS